MGLPRCWGAVAVLERQTVFCSTRRAKQELAPPTPQGSAPVCFGGSCGGLPFGFGSARLRLVCRWARRQWKNSWQSSCPQPERWGTALPNARLKNTGDTNGPRVPSCDHSALTSSAYLRDSGQRSWTPCEPTAVRALGCETMTRSPYKREASAGVQVCRWGTAQVKVLPPLQLTPRPGDGPACCPCGGLAGAYRRGKMP